MFSRKRFLAGASAVALAAGTTLAGAGVASAQDEEESTGSISSSSLNLGETVADLETAAAALNGPVTVAGNEEGGPTVTYTNVGDALEHCVGFTLPYASVEETGLDPSGAGDDPMGLLEPILEIQEMGGVAMLMPGGETFEATADNGIAQAALMLIALKAGTPVQADETVSWDAATPDEPSAAAFLCIPDAVEGNDERIAAIATGFGVDPQVVADQINGKLGPLGSVGPEMISGGSVDTGVTVLGSLASASAGEEEGPVEPPVEEPAE